MPADIKHEKRALARSLRLSNEAAQTCEFLAEMGHLRYRMRVEGWTPQIYATDRVSSEIAKRFNYKKMDLYFLTPDEIGLMYRQKRAVIAADEIAKRRGQSDEYMILLQKGRLKFLWGTEAGRKLKELYVPPVKTEQLNGSSAYLGRVESTVTVYKWGDDMAATLKQLRENPILVSGQTRPAMMPLLRKAKGIITDEGGVTSHAAIIARELKIPTIIGTTHGTKVLKTGDRIILDAEKGIVEIL
jgi:phosphohistidine swiveling domain-containing protein